MDHIRGDSHATATIIDYSDYQCPYSKQIHSELKQLIDESSSVRWVLRNRPLESIHQLALQAAIAAECAAKQGKFWQYSDALFDNQTALGKSTFDELAEGLNLNSVEFRACRSSDMTSFIARQASEAAALEIDATPTLFVNGRRFTGLMSHSELMKAVRQ